MEEIEARAERVLSSVPPYIWDGESLPVPVEDVVESHYGLLVRDVADLTTAPDCPKLEPGESLSGLLLATRGEIWVDAGEAREWPRRRRFTICHELGHWVLHRAGRRAVFCRSTTVQPELREAAGTDAPTLPDIEEEASAFAAALLMPAHLIRREYERDRTFERLCERFGASGAAMGKRLHAVI